MAADPARLAETLCIEEERVVARDNTVAYEGRTLQLPASPLRAHYVKARVKVREYPDGTLAVFHGPRRIARYTAQGRRSHSPDHPQRDTVLAAVKAWPGDAVARRIAAATAILDGVCARRHKIWGRSGHGVIAG